MARFLLILSSVWIGNAMQLFAMAWHPIEKPEAFVPTGVVFLCFSLVAIIASVVLD